VPAHDLLDRVEFAVDVTERADHHEQDEREGLDGRERWRKDSGLMTVEGSV
jgi:hypothetical protein